MNANARAQADIHLSSKLPLQVGGRVTHDRNKTSLEQGGFFENDVPAFAPYEFSPGR